VPLTISGIISEGMLSFVTAINELSASLVLHVEGAITTPVRIYLLVLSGLAVYIAFRFHGSQRTGAALAEVAIAMRWQLLLPTDIP